MAVPLSISQGFHPIWVVALLTLAFAALARVLRGVTWSGAIAGAVVCFVLYYSAGPGAFILLTLLFILTWSSTRLGYQRKLKLGTAEKKEGRTASQVLANVGVAAVCAAAYRWRVDTVFLLAMCAALAEAAADTVSSELGQTSSADARLVTTWHKVPAGTNGGVTLVGTLAGIGAAFLITLAAMFLDLLGRRDLFISLFAASVGMICDSFLGSTLERDHLLNNDSVNLLGTLSAVAVVAVWHVL
jgi:uncharacterized protein (TIGR00297 family)